MTTPPVPAGSIVVGVDGTPASDRALSWAVAQARARHLGLTVLHATGRHATTAPAEPGEAGGGTASSLRADGRQVTRTAVHSLRRAGFDGAVEELLVPASAVDALVEASTDADLLVVGAREPGPLGTFVLGSVRRSLVDRSRCPVVVVPAPGPSEDGRGVLVAVADQEPSRAALDFAYLQARLTDSPVTVLGCLLESGRVLAGSGAPDAGDVERHRDFLREVTAPYTTDLPDVVTTIEVDRGPVDEAVVRTAPGHDLVVLGARAHSWISRLFGRDGTHWVVAQAPCPVAIVPEPDGNPSSPT
jgi:nucleotide-binding universal stress UspA family protein